MCGGLIAFPRPESNPDVLPAVSGESDFVVSSADFTRKFGIELKRNEVTSLHHECFLVQTLGTHLGHDCRATAAIAGNKVSVIWSQRREHGTIELRKYGIGDQLLNLDQRAFVMVLALLLSLAADPMESGKQTELSQCAKSFEELFLSMDTSGNQQNSNKTNELPKTEGGQDQSRRSGNDVVEDVEKDENFYFGDEQKENIDIIQGGVEGEEEIGLGIPADIWKPMQLTATDGSVFTINRLRDNLDETIREKIFAVFSISRY